MGNRLHPNQIKSIADELYSFRAEKISYLMGIDGEKTAGIILNWKDSDQLKIVVQNDWNKYNRQKPTKTMQHWRTETVEKLNEYIKTKGIDTETKDRIEAFQHQVNTYFEQKQPEENSLPEIEKKLSITEKIRLLQELGIIDHLKEKHPNLKPADYARLLHYFIDEKETSIKPVITSLINNDASNRNYPTKSERIDNILNKLRKGK
jgi:hypothetical protein